MINGTHVLLYSTDADADRAFIKKHLGLRSVDAGRGWLIFELPPAELAVHPGDATFAQTHAGHTMIGAVVYFMCDDLPATIKSLNAKGVHCTEITEAPWGVTTTIKMPSGGEVGLYEPRHPVAIRRASARKTRRGRRPSARSPRARRTTRRSRSRT